MNAMVEPYLLAYRATTAALSPLAPLLLRWREGRGKEDGGGRGGGGSSGSPECGGPNSWRRRRGWAADSQADHGGCV